MHDVQYILRERSYLERGKHFLFFLDELHDFPFVIRIISEGGWI